MYRIAGNLCEVEISRFSRFDPICESSFTKSLISMHNANYQHTNCEFNTVKCLFEHEIAKYPSAIFSPLYGIYYLRKNSEASHD